MVLGAIQNSTFGTMYHRRKHDTYEQSIINGPLRTLEIAMKEVEARKAEAFRRGVLPDHFTIIEHGPVRIIVSGTPNAASLPAYAAKLARHNVKNVVRFCEPSYSADHLRQFGLNVYDWPFEDGDAPPEHIITKWLALLERVFHISQYAKLAGSDSSALSDDGSDFDFSATLKRTTKAPRETIAIHCAAGLGRAPVIAALALVELGIDSFEAVGWIRALRRGAINASQMAFVESYANRPPPPPAKRKGKTSRSSSFVGSFWPSLKAARFRPRSPTHKSASSTPPTSRPSSRRTSYSLYRHADY